MELDSEFKPGWPIRQGDLIGFWDWAQLPPLRRFGIIITADCDLARARRDQEVIYLKMLSQKDYVDLVWSREKLQAERARRIKELAQTFTKHRQQKDSEGLEFSPNDAEAWIAKATGAQICADLDIAKEDAVLALSDRIAVRLE